ncbi:MAG TPA: DinB family protein [Thermoanaerobaculia bacterium]|nr:DinB family protein [Thermoanaerobaculia bacterium]HQR68091.1 DinB family protein [Thermoanaerobaculia bacterium]
MATATPGPVIPEKYASALGGEDPVEAMAETPDRLRRLIRSLTERQLAKKPAPGKWSIKEIVAHLADGEIILGSRYRLIASHDRPAIGGYDQDAFVANLGVSNAKTADLIDDFAMARAANLGLLDRLPREAWDRVGVHAERGEESIRKMVFMYAGHDRHHLQQIETIRTGLFPKKGKRPARARKPAARKPAGKR